jgi:hypothetical protein
MELATWKLGYDSDDIFDVRLCSQGKSEGDRLETCFRSKHVGRPTRY